VVSFHVCPIYPCIVYCLSAGTENGWGMRRLVIVVRVGVSEGIENLASNVISEKDEE
jgi:hypothetical protein